MAPAPSDNPLQPAAGDAGQTAWLLCRAGTVLCALPLAQVVEVMRLLPIEMVAGAVPPVRGLCIIRGAPVPVVDAGSLLGESTMRAERLVAIRVGARRVALAVTSVLGIRWIEAQALHRLPPLLRDAASETIAAIGTLDAQLMFFLNAARIVPPALLEGAEPAGGAA